MTARQGLFLTLASVLFAGRLMAENPPDSASPPSPSALSRLRDFSFTDVSKKNIVSQLTPVLGRDYLWKIRGPGGVVEELFYNVHDGNITTIHVVFVKGMLKSITAMDRSARVLDVLYPASAS